MMASRRHHEPKVGSLDILGVRLGGRAGQRGRDIHVTRAPTGSPVGALGLCGLYPPPLEVDYLTVRHA
jgi:hypothetical protein